MELILLAIVIAGAAWAIVRALNRTSAVGEAKLLAEQAVTLTASQLEAATAFAEQIARAFYNLEEKEPSQGVRLFAVIKARLGCGKIEAEHHVTELFALYEAQTEVEKKLFDPLALASVRLFRLVELPRHAFTGGDVKALSTACLRGVHEAEKAVSE